MVESGMPAPVFTLDSDDAGPISLSELRGRTVVLYFYPKDDTPGCTVQACDFRDSLPRFEGVDAVVLGVSPDTVESHRAFREKFDLNFSLLADTDGHVSDLYSVRRERSVQGRPVMGIERSTFLIDGDGIVVGVWRKVDPQGHMEMLAELVEG